MQKLQNPCFTVATQPIKNNLNKVEKLNEVNTV